MKKILNLFLIINFLCMPAMQALALDFDISLDDEIRKNYNPSKIEEDMALPALPKIIELESSMPVNQYSAQSQTRTQYQQPLQKAVLTSAQTPNSGNYAILKKGTKFRTKLVTSVSDRSGKGDFIKLVTIYPVTTTYLTIPAGSVLEGRITNVHPPQLSGNGGLIQMRITSMNLYNSQYPMDAYVTEANFRDIFFNNIKGQRRYAKSLFNSIKPGVSFYKKMICTSARLLNDGGAAFWSPFPFAAGIGVLGANVAASPVIALFSKGKSVYLRSGSDVEIKLSQDIIIYN